MLAINERPIGFYLGRLIQGQYFCFPGYSDAEFYCMMGIREGNKTGLGQILSKEHGDKLTNVMRRRQKDKRWFFAIPKCLKDLPVFQASPIDKFLEGNGIKVEGYERDMILDDAARDAKLYPLIHQLQKMETILIGPEELGNGGLNFLDFKLHLPIPSPNLHMEKNGIEWVIENCISRNYAGVYLISAGVSAPVIIDRLYDWNPDNFYLDVGSIWDAFCGIGGQRQWRADLYRHPIRLKDWKRKNIHGT